MINPLTPKNRVKIKLAHGTVALLLLGGIERGARAGGTGTLDHGSGWYPAGMKLVVRATPDPNSLFAGWQGQTNGSSVNGNEISWVVNESVSVTGMFSALSGAGQHAVVKQIQILGKSVLLTVTNGVPGNVFWLTQSPDLLIPLGRWQTNWSGTCDAQGNLVTNVPNIATNPSGFFMLY